MLQRAGSRWRLRGSGTVTVSTAGSNSPVHAEVRANDRNGPIISKENFRTCTVTVSPEQLGEGAVVVLSPVGGGLFRADASLAVHVKISDAHSENTVRIEGVRAGGRSAAPVAHLSPHEQGGLDIVRIDEDVNAANGDRPADRAPSPLAQLALSAVRRHEESNGARLAVKTPVSRDGSLSFRLYDPSASAVVKVAECAVSATAVVVHPAGTARSDEWVGTVGHVPESGVFVTDLPPVSGSSTVRTIVLGDPRLLDVLAADALVISDAEAELLIAAEDSPATNAVIDRIITFIAEPRSDS